MSDIPKDLQKQAEQAALLQADVETKVKELKNAQKSIDETWDKVKDVMIDNGIKSIKGDWGSITIAERTTYSPEGDLSEVPSKFVKKVLDTTKVGTYSKLEGKLPKGVKSSVTEYLSKRIKG